MRLYKTFRLETPITSLRIGGDLTRRWRRAKPKRGEVAVDWSPSLHRDEVILLLGWFQMQNSHKSQDSSHDCSQQFKHGRLAEGSVQQF